MNSLRELVEILVRGAAQSRAAWERTERFRVECRCPLGVTVPKTLSPDQVCTLRGCVKSEFIETSANGGGVGLGFNARRGGAAGIERIRRLINDSADRAAMAR